MWKLTIEDDQGNRIPVPLVRDDYSIGRGPENTLRLTERNVSRQHASLRRENGRWLLVDLDSYNGSYINGQRVPGQQELADGDLIQLGDYRIEIVEDAAAVALVPEQPAEEEAVPPPVAHENGLAQEQEREEASDDFAAMAAAMEPAAAWPHEEPPARKAGGKKAGMIVGAVAALAIGGAVFAFSGSKSAPEPTAAVATTPAPQPAERAPEPAPTQAPVEEPAPAAEEPAAEVAQAIDLDEEPPKQEEAPAPSRPEPSPQPTTPVRVASAPAEEKRPRTTQAAAPAPAAPKPTATSARRPVLAANPFDDPAPATKTTTKSAKSPSQSSSKGGSSFAELAAQGREGEAKMRPILEQRVARGTASEADIKLLRAICRNMGDRVCADRMSALLAKKN